MGECKLDPSRPVIVACTVGTKIAELSASEYGRVLERTFTGGGSSMLWGVRTGAKLTVGRGDPGGLADRFLVGVTVWAPGVRGTVTGGIFWDVDGFGRCLGRSRWVGMS